MTQQIARRTITSAAWTIPAIAACAPAPAFAASRPIDCAPQAECKDPGEGSNTKDYRIRTNCSSSTNPIAKVEVYDDKQKIWIEATANGDGTFTAKEFNDSRRDRQVRVTDSFGQVATYTVAFPPC